MPNYKDYTKNAFLAMRETYAEQGFALYQPKNNENFIAYATRYGLVHVWQFDEETQAVTITCVTLPDPSALHVEVFDKLIVICAHQKHWRGGIHKLRHYLRHIGEELLDQEGIDPFFYAWMVEYGVDTTNRYESDYFDCFNDILRQSEYTSVVGLASIISEDPVELAKDFVTKREGLLISFEDYANKVLSVNKRVQRVRELVDAELPIGATEELRANLTYDILRLIDNAVEQVTAE